MVTPTVETQLGVVYVVGFYESPGPTGDGRYVGERVVVFEDVETGTRCYTVGSAFSTQAGMGIFCVPNPNSGHFKENLGLYKGSH